MARGARGGRRPRPPGAAICAHLTASPFWNSATTVGAYLAAPRLREVDPGAAVRAALERRAPTMFVPVVGGAPASMRLLHLDAEGGLVETKPFGIREPAPCYAGSSTPRRDALDAGLDLLLLPGAAFDAAGGRLGRGGGYYDAFVAAAAAAAAARGVAPPLLVGLAFAAQVCPSVPVEAHDARLDVLVTAGGAAGVSERGRRAVRG